MSTWKPVANTHADIRALTDYGHAAFRLVTDECACALGFALAPALPGGLGGTRSSGVFEVHGVPADLGVSADRVAR